MRIEPAAVDALQDAELRALVAQAQALGVPDERFVRIVARVPQYAKVLLRALLVSHVEGNVDHRLKELIRIRLAEIARDPYFARLRSTQAIEQGLSEDRVAASARYENDPSFTEAEQWALRYAERMYLAPQEIDAAFYDELKRHYSEAQIMELGAFIAFHYGMQVFMRTFAQ